MHESSQQRALEELLLCGANDWVHATELAWVSRSVGGAATDDEVRNLSLELVREVLSRGLMSIGQVTEQGFAPWVAEAGAAIQRANQEWRSLEHLPTLGELFWLANTPAGDARAQALRAQRPTPPSASTTLKAWLFHAEIAAWILTLGLVIASEPKWAAACALLALGADIAGRLWSRQSPVPMPYFMRWTLLVPRGSHSPSRVQQMLQPRSGERILEVGPGVGVHALPIAAALQPDGVLDVLDVQQEMLDDLMRRAARRGLGNIVPRRGDAQRLSYPDARFDAAYLVSVLGEIPDATSALRELRRVLKPGGRLLICEVFVDPDFISLPALQALARDAGFEFERRSGPRFAYTALFRPMAAAARQLER